MSNIYTMGTKKILKLKTHTEKVHLQIRNSNSYSPKNHAHNFKSHMNQTNNSTGIKQNKGQQKRTEIT